MTFAKRVASFIMRSLSHAICRIDATQLSRVPVHGPLILAVNHVNFLDAPVLYTQLEPRPITGYAKVETWDNPILGYLFDLFDAIPIHRGTADIAALRAGITALEAGQILVVAPEGTRSGHGRLQRSHAGVAFLALRSGAPILPVVIYGGEKYRSNLKRLRRTDFHITVGYPFYLQAGDDKVTSDVRSQMTDEVMWQLAALLPPEYRGVYANLDAATERYLRFPPHSATNLKIA